ncbi:sugar ABC transporter ATP-binding protein [Hypericibacter terrae]|nr:sugar ABC transporter ATP-binding protein [Hypericibacter terrae]
MGNEPASRLSAAGPVRLARRPPSAMTESAILRVENVSKSFAGVTTLDSVSLSAARNQIVGIVGENGAGKTTLFNIISGIIPADGGRVALDGREIHPANYREASLLGISRVFQEQALIPNIAVYENLLLAHEDRFVRWGQLIDTRRMIEVAERIVSTIGLDIDVRRPTSDYDFSVRQTIEIARACLVPQMVLGIEHPVILLDEPTSALARNEEEAFFKLIAGLKQHGTVLFVSHRLNEVLRISDVIYVMKDGRIVAEVDPAGADERKLHGLMVGRARDEDYYHERGRQSVEAAAPALRVEHLSRRGDYLDISLTLRQGEVLGIGGLLDSGKSALGKGIAGVLASDQGTVAIGDRTPARPELRRLMAQGFGYVPAERHAEGMITAFPVSWNISLASGSDLFSSEVGYWRGRLENSVSRSFIERLRIKANGPGSICSRLSGGNQQKVVLAKWLCRDPRVLVLDNPTRGVDAGAKEEIYALIRKLTAEGVAVLLITDELLELIGLSNRIAIMSQGRITATVPAPVGAKPTEDALVALMLGYEANRTEALPDALPRGTLH